MSNYTLIKYKRTRGSVYKVDGWLYIKNKATTGGFYLVCALKKSPEHHCQATAKYKEAGDVVDMQKSHCHARDAYEDGLAGFKVSLNLAAADPMDLRTARQKFDALSAANPAAGRSVTFRQVESAMAKAKRGKFPPIPKTGQEFHAMLEDDHAAVYAANYLAMAEVGGNYAFAFMAEGLRDTFRSAKSISWDGTFFVTPRPFAQYFLLHMELGDYMVPVLHILMQAKSQALYTAIFAKVRSAFPQFMPEFGMGDFELASANAFRAIWPSISIRGCAFHFAKSLFARIQKEGLVRLFKRDQAFKTWARMTMSLVYLPADAIEPTFAQLESELPALNMGDGERAMVSRYVR